MALSEWVSDTLQRVRNDPVSGLIASLYELYLGGLRRSNPFKRGSTHIYEREWDVLVLLDACRTDLIAEVTADYPFLSNPGAMTSVGSSSIDWMENTFTGEYSEEMRETAYVTGNPFSKRVLEPRDLCYLDEVWRYAWDDKLGTIPARHVTDRAIAAGRERECERLIVHYMQPHFPSIPRPVSGGMNADTLGEGKGWDSPWQRLRRDEIEYNTLWASYRKNLRYVLDDVAVLLRNLDAEKVVLSADHGNAAGEWGVYGHPKVPLESIRTVPWYETAATNTGNYEPELEPGSDRGNLEEKLEALGYL